jgi:hypothetical protein
MSSAYYSSVVARDGKTATIRVYQHHPDYGLDPKYFVEEWGAMAIAGWAFPDGYAVTNFGRTHDDVQYEKVVPPGSEPTALAQRFGSFGNLFDAPASEVPGLRVTKVELVRSAYGEEIPERLVAAGYEEDEDLVHEVVMKICGILDITIEAEDESLIAPLVVGVEWEY